MIHFIFCKFAVPTTIRLVEYSISPIVGNGILFDTNTKKAVSRSFYTTYYLMERDHGIMNKFFNRSTPTSELLRNIESLEKPRERCHIVNNLEELYSILDNLTNPKPKFNFVDLTIEF